MNAPAARAPRLRVSIPKAAALRRSWLAALAQRDGRVSYEIAALVRLVAPDLQINLLNVADCYFQLCQAVSRLFPLYEYFLEDIDTEDIPYLWRMGGIPLAPEGYSPYDESAALALAAANLGLCNGAAAGTTFPNRPDTPQAQAAEDFRALANVDLRWWAGPLAVPEGAWRNWKIKPPRGRAWAGAWAGLPDLIDYVYQRTGNAWLDYSQEGLEDGGYMMPAWHIEEIRALERGWKAAQPILERVQALAAEIDRANERGLQLLDRVMRGEVKALHRVTRPKVTAAGKTLAQIWS